jgi:hypothetical protein
MVNNTGKKIVILKATIEARDSIALVNRVQGVACSGGDASTYRDHH